MQTHESRIITSIGKDDDDLPTFIYEGFRVQVPDEADAEEYIFTALADGTIREMPNFRIWGPQTNSAPKSPMAAPTLAGDGIIRTHDLVSPACQAAVDAWFADQAPEPPPPEGE